MNCPACGDAIITMRAVREGRNVFERMIYPQSMSRPLPSEVEEPFRSEFTEACVVLASSEKASAALSRRCLQMLLVTKGGAKARDLYDQIEETLPTLPADVAESLHAVRAIGNFAAHPMKSKSTGDIVDVESGEAEWNLETLEQLFDFYFVRPAAQAKRKAALNAKLVDLGKPGI
jgi:hypothetical protein